VADEADEADEGRGVIMHTARILYFLVTSYVYMNPRRYRAGTVFLTRRGYGGAMRSAHAFFLASAAFLGLPTRSSMIE
jgi:hypothetical protein